VATDVEKLAERAVELAQQQPRAPIEPLVSDDGTPTPAGWRKIGELFRRQMPSKTFTAGRRGQFSYITARQVAARLDEVVGPGNWRTAFIVIDREAHAVECTLSVYNVPRSDVGYPNNPDAEPGDAQFEHEPLKAAYSDAFKRAAVQWGIGRFLYGEVQQ